MAAGDVQAAAEFVHRFQGRVFGLALSIVRSAAVAEEIAQETFVRAWRFAGGHDPRRGPVAGWLLAITRNAAVDVVRLSREQPFDPRVLFDMLADRSSAASAAADHVADVDRIRDALAAVPTEQAVAVVAAVMYGLTAQEIANQQGIPLGTAKTRIRLGLARLREQLEVGDGREV
jgi:RNA polymerase sigma factor (sigma-70 family)